MLQLKLVTEFVRDNVLFNPRRDGGYVTSACRTSGKGLPTVLASCGAAESGRTCL